MLYYTDKNWYHFIKEYLEQISKFAFQEVACPVGGVGGDVVHKYIFQYSEDCKSEHFPQL